MNKTVSLSFRIVTAVLFAVSAAQAGAQSTAPSPLANPAAVVTCGGARFTVLTPEMIRIEYSETAQFEDRATFTIVNRNLDVPSYMTTDDGTYLYITTDRLTLKYRKGCDPRALEAILRSAAKRLVYVSCNPATLARDLKLLTAGGFRIETVQPVDMFPQTCHVETVVLLSRS